MSNASITFGCFNFFNIAISRNEINGNYDQELVLLYGYKHFLFTEVMLLHAPVETQSEQAH